MSWRSLLTTRNASPSATNFLFANIPPLPLGEHQRLVVEALKECFYQCGGVAVHLRTAIDEENLLCLVIVVHLTHILIVVLAADSRHEEQERCAHCDNFFHVSNVLPRVQSYVYSVEYPFTQIAACRHKKAEEMEWGKGKREKKDTFIVCSTVREVVRDVAFGNFGELLFPVDRRVPDDMTLGEVSSSNVYVWYNYIRPETTIDIVNTLRRHAISGDTIFFRFYTEEEIHRDPEEAYTGLLLLSDIVSKILLASRHVYRWYRFLSFIKEIIRIFARYINYSR